MTRRPPILAIALLAFTAAAFALLSSPPHKPVALAPIAASNHDEAWNFPHEVTTTTTTVARPVVKRATRSYRRPVVASNGSLDRIAMCESGGSYTAANAHSTASGRYQVLDSTWGNYGGYHRAKDAPPDVQEQQAQELYARSGSSPWNASRGCWG